MFFGRWEQVVQRFCKLLSDDGTYTRCPSGPNIDDRESELKEVLIEWFLCVDLKVSNSVLWILPYYGKCGVNHMPSSMPMTNTFYVSGQ